MLVQHGGQHSQGAGEGDLVRGAGDNVGVELLFHGIAGAAVRQLFMAGIFAADGGGNVLQRVIPGWVFHVLEGEINHGILALEAAIVFAAGPDGFILEINGGIRRSALKENPQHIHVQGFAKAPGPGKQRHLGQCVDEIADQ